MDVKILEIKQSVFANNDRQAAQMRSTLKERGIYLLNVMSSPARRQRWLPRFRR